MKLQSIPIVFLVFHLTELLFAVIQSLIVFGSKGETGDRCNQNSPIQKEKRSTRCNTAKGVVRSSNPGKNNVHLLADLNQLAHGIKRDAIAKEDDCSDDDTKKDQPYKEAAISAVPGNKRATVAKTKPLTPIVNDDEIGETKIVPIIQMGKASIRSEVASLNNTSKTSLKGNETKTENGSASTAIIMEGQDKRTTLHHRKGSKRTSPIHGSTKEKDKAANGNVVTGVHRSYHSPIVPAAAPDVSKTDGGMNVGASPPTSAKDKVSVGEAKSAPVTGLKSSSVTDSKSSSTSMTGTSVTGSKAASSSPSGSSDSKASSASTSGTTAAKAASSADPYAEIAQGPDSPKLPELKTGNEAAGAEQSAPMLKMDESASKPQASSSSSSAPVAGGQRSTPQDVGGLLDSLTDRLNSAGGGVAPEQPLPMGESKSIQDQLSQFDQQALQQAKGWEANGVKAIKALKMGELTGAVNDLSAGRPMGDLNAARSDEAYNDFLNTEATREEPGGGQYDDDYGGNIEGSPGGGAANSDMFDAPTGGSYLGAANAAMGQASEGADSFERRTLGPTNSFEGLEDRRESDMNGYNNQYFKRSIILRPIYYYYKHLPYAFKHPYDD